MRCPASRSEPSIPVNSSRYRNWSRSSRTRSSLSRTRTVWRSCGNGATPVAGLQIVTWDCPASDWRFSLVRRARKLGPTRCPVTSYPANVRMADNPSPILRGATDPPEDAIAYLESVPIEKLLGGISRFQKDVYPKHQDLFEKLAMGQRPEALFITCADSRIDPCLLTQTKPGELFICRVIGNVVPPYPDAIGGVSATIEYAVGVLRVPEVIVCGHTDCGVMRGALNPEALEAYPNVTAWLRYAKVDHREPEPSAEFLLALTEDNVVAQLKNLTSHPTVMARLEQGDLALHGWVYHIGPGTVTAYDEASRRFETPASEHHS